MAINKNVGLFLSEFVCTALLVCCTCLAHYKGENTILPLGIAYGALNLFLTMCFNHASGGYGNPAIVLALLIRGCISKKRFLVYVAGEIVGAAFGHYVFHILYGKPVSEGLCVFLPKANLTEAKIVVSEFMFTFLVVMTWCVLLDFHGEFPMAWYIGAANSLVYYLGICLTGACTNPARTLAPSFFQKTHEAVKYCVVGQLLAGIAAPLLWECLKSWGRL